MKLAAARSLRRSWFMVTAIGGSGGREVSDDGVRRARSRSRRALRAAPGQREAPPPARPFPTAQRREADRSAGRGGAGVGHRAGECQLSARGAAGSETPEESQEIAPGKGEARSGTGPLRRHVIGRGGKREAKSAETGWRGDREGAGQ